MKPAESFRKIASGTTQAPAEAADNRLHRPAKTTSPGDVVYFNEVSPPAAGENEVNYPVPLNNNDF